MESLMVLGPVTWARSNHGNQSAEGRNENATKSLNFTQRETCSTREKTLSPHAIAISLLVLQLILGQEDADHDSDIASRLL